MAHGPISHFIGEKINDWTIIEINTESRYVKYHVQCKCGYKKYCQSSGLFKLTSCRFCIGKSFSSHLVGKRFGKFLVLDNHIHEGKRKLKVRCDCSHEYYITPYQLKTQNSCKLCRFNLYSGKKIDGMELLEYLGYRKYKIRCVCGNIFEKIPRKWKGTYSNCGCVTKKKYLDRSNKYIGKKHGYLTVKKFLRNENGHNIYLIKCICGKIFERPGGHFFKSKSCGCRNNEFLPKGEKANNSKLKDNDILTIRQLYENKIYTLEEIASMFNITKNYVSRIVTKRIWKSL